MAQEFQFGEFTLDLPSYRLQRAGRRVRLEKLPMELLILLVQRQGELVSREEIAERLWGKDVFLDVDHGINTAIRKIRRTLRDDSEKPRFVETVVGKGYRFAAPVTCSQEPSSPAPELVVHAPAVSPAVSGKDRRASVRLRIALGILALLGVLATTWALRRGLATPRPSHAEIRSLAVLPLKNLSGDPSQEYFADGMTEELIGRLSEIPGLRVISRTSAMRFKDTHESVPAIARTLHVDAIVEGSVLREGNRVRIDVQLIRGATDEHIWGEDYQREYGSIIALQQEMAQTIARKIQITVTPQAAAREVAPQAHENYLKGRFYFNQRTAEALNHSIAYFRQAIAIDPNYALAYSGLAEAYALLGFRGSIPSKNALAQAKAAAQKAISLNDSLAEPHVSLAFIAETYEWDWATAEREYKRALELNPSDARTHHWYAGYLIYVGRFDAGVAEEERARELDPVSLPINNALAGRLLVAGHYDQALAQVRNTLQLDAHFAPAYQTLGWAYLGEGRRRQAVEQFQRALQLSGHDDTDLLLDLGFAYAAAGDRQSARKILDNLKQLHARGLASSASVAILYGALGELNEAFAWLEKAYAERDPELTYLQVPNRRFEPLRQDPRFQQMVRRIGFPQLKTS